MGELPGPILLTGGTGALGRAVVEELLGAGAQLTASWIVAEERRELVEALGSESRLGLVEADVSTERGASVAVEAAGRGEPLAGLVNLVGGFAAGGRVHEAPADELERMLELNLLTAYRTSRAALPGMLEAGQGAIVCVGARAALEPFTGAAGYAVSKAAVVALVRALAVEYRDDGIRTNAILPSVIDTPANREAMPKADHASWVPPPEIARVVRFLLSEDSAPTSGAAIPVYGRA